MNTATPFPDNEFLQTVIPFLNQTGKARCISQTGIATAATAFGLSPREVMRRCLQQHIWPTRFVRNYGTLTSADQATLLQSHVAVMGCGGLGGHVLLLLARLGVGILSCCDPDVFEETNLNRQALCCEDTIGANKAETAQHELLRVASHVTVHAYPARATAETLPSLLTGVDVVADCLDSLLTRREVEAAAHAAHIPFVHAALAGREGFTMLCPPPASGLARLYPGPLPTREECAEQATGVPTLTPAALAVLQASIIVNVLLQTRNRESSPESLSLLHMDLEVPCIDSIRV